MLKIVTTHPAPGNTVLRLEGQIIGAWVEELRRTCDRLLRTTTVALDLADVSFVERRGVQLLRALGARGVPLLHCSAFVAEQLKVSVPHDVD